MIDHVETASIKISEANEKLTCFESTNHEVAKRLETLGKPLRLGWFMQDTLRPGDGLYNFMAVFIAALYQP